MILVISSSCRLVASVAFSFQNLQLNGLEEVSLLGLRRVLEEFGDVGTHSGCLAGYKMSVKSNYLIIRKSSHGRRTDCDLRHIDSLPIESI